MKPTRDLGGVSLIDASSRGDPRPPHPPRETRPSLSRTTRRFFARRPTFTSDAASARSRRPRGATRRP